jgi:hypothetical protein
MSTLEIVPSVLDRIRKTLVGLKMPRALEVLDQAVRQLERGETSALAASPDDLKASLKVTCFAK